VDSAGQRLYVSHASQVVVIDLAKDQVAGEITNTPGVHGIAVAPQLNRGFTSNGRENKVSIVDLKTLQTLSRVDTGTNPDAILFEPGQNEIYAFNGRGQSATVIGAKSGKVVATIPLGGKPEFAEADSKAGRVFNNLEDKSEVAAMTPGRTRSRIVGRLRRARKLPHCDDQKKPPAVSWLRQQTDVMMDSTNGKVLATVPIGRAWTEAPLIRRLNLPLLRAAMAQPRSRMKIRRINSPSCKH